MPVRITVHQPSHDLRALVDYYQSVSIDAASMMGHRERVIPNPRYSFIFHFGDSYEGCHASRPDFRMYPQNLIATPMEHSVIVRPAGRTEALRVAMRPHTIERVLRVSASSMRNVVPDANDVFDRNGRDLIERMTDASGMEQRIALFEQWLRGQVAVDRSRRLAEMDFAVNRLIATDGQLRIGELAGELAVSERQLERWFLRSIGLRPKFFQRVVRLNALLQAVGSDNAPDWAALASQFGFADQSHLVRDFAMLAGESPATYLRNARLMRVVFQQSMDGSPFAQAHPLASSRWRGIPASTRSGARASDRPGTENHR